MQPDDAKAAVSRVYELWPRTTKEQMATTFDVLCRDEFERDKLKNAMDEAYIDNSKWFELSSIMAIYRGGKGKPQTGESALDRTQTYRQSLFAKEQEVEREWEQIRAWSTTLSDDEIESFVAVLKCESLDLFTEATWENIQRRGYRNSRPLLGELWLKFGKAKVEA